MSEWVCPLRLIRTYCWNPRTRLFAPFGTRPPLGQAPLEISLAWPSDTGTSRVLDVGSWWRGYRRLVVSVKALADSLRERAGFVEQAVVVDLIPVRSLEIDDFAISMAAGPSDEIVVVSSPVPLPHRPTEETRLLMESGWPSTAHVISPNDERVVPTPEFGGPHWLVQPLPEGRSIVVNRRTYPLTRTPDPNAFVMDDGGGIEHSFVIGDDVESMKTTSDGRIWVGYGDEGVFGRNHFGESCGLTRWNPEGVREWAFTQPDGERIEWNWVSAINVCDRDVWVGGRVCVSHDDRISVRPRRPSHPFHSQLTAVDGSWTALVGSGGRQNRDLVFLNHPDVDPSLVAGPILLQLPDHRLLPKHPLVDVRRDTIHYLVDNTWFSIDIEALVAARTGK